MEIAGVLRTRYGLNPRAAFRVAHGWNQREAAEEWNRRWPDEPKTFKNFSYWENWPTPSGHPPSLDTLARLAEIYECSSSELVADFGDFLHLDPASSSRTRLAEVHEAASGMDGSYDQIRGVVERASTSSVEDQALLFAAWAERIGIEADRKNVFLRLSAGLALAAAAARPNHELPAPDETRPAPTCGGLNGIWLSRYVHRSTSRGVDVVGQHYVAIRADASRCIARSLPHSKGSVLTLELSIGGMMATGLWSERTSPSGHYRGAVYHGSLQLVIAATAKEMRGRWVGFGKDYRINTGEWEMTFVDASLSPKALRKYRLAV